RITLGVDHYVGDERAGRMAGRCQCLGGGGVDRLHLLGRRRYTKVGRVLAFQDAVDVGAGRWCWSAVGCDHSAVVPYGTEGAKCGITSVAKRLRLSRPLAPPPEPPPLMRM